MKIGGVSVNKGLREFVALVYVATVLGLILWSLHRPPVMDGRLAFFMFIELSFGVFVMASGIVIWGPRVLEAGMEMASRLRDSGGEDGGGGA